MDDFLVKPVSLASCSADRVEDYLGFAFTVLSVAVGDKSEVVSVFHLLCDTHLGFLLDGCLFLIVPV